jgi:hypothetical protein
MPRRSLGLATTRLNLSNANRVEQLRPRGPAFALLFALTSVLITGLLLFVSAGGFSGRPCPADGLFAETPPGWDFSRDHMNGCAWTLFNEGERAPDELYEGLSVEPPGPVHLYPLMLWAVGAIVASIIGFVHLAFRGQRRFPL